MSNPLHFKTASIKTLEIKSIKYALGLLIVLGSITTYTTIKHIPEYSLDFNLVFQITVQDLLVCRDVIKRIIFGIPQTRKIVRPRKVTNQNQLCSLFIIALVCQDF